MLKIWDNMAVIIFKMKDIEVKSHCAKVENGNIQNILVKTVEKNTGTRLCLL